MGGESRQKVDLKGLIQALISEVEEIDADESLSRSKKTGKIARAAQKFKSRLHDDKRIKHKIAEKTYLSYMSSARREVTRKNWRHHSLDKEVKRLSKKYPDLSESLQKLLSYKDISDLRVAHKKLYKALVKHIAFEDIRWLKTDHEVMRHLVVSESVKLQVKAQDKESLDAKKSNVTHLKYDRIVEIIHDLLNKKTKIANGVSSYSYSRLALGLALATGRRAVEVLHQGILKPRGPLEMTFSGQAKKRGGADYSIEYQIYSLVDSKIVAEKLEELRRLPEMTTLAEEVEGLPEFERNTAINKKCASNLNRTIRVVFNDSTRVFKDSRAIWARCVFDKHFSADPKWHSVDEDVFWKEMLGHDDIETQKAYKQFKIEYPETKKTLSYDKDRIDALEKLDSEFAKRRALLKIHDWVKGQIKEDPKIIITQTLITRELGSNRNAIKDYLEIAKDALEYKIEKIEKKASEIAKEAYEHALEAAVEARNHSDSARDAYSIAEDEIGSAEAAAEDAEDAAEEAKERWYEAQRAEAKEDSKAAYSYAYDAIAAKTVADESLERAESATYQAKSALSDAAIATEEAYLEAERAREEVPPKAKTIKPRIKAVKLDDGAYEIVAHAGDDEIRLVSKEDKQTAMIRAYKLIMTAHNN